MEHSACGAQAAEEIYGDPVGLMMAYCIAGHHTGLPDGGQKNHTAQMATLQGRLKKQFEDYSRYKEELSLPAIDRAQWIAELTADCQTKDFQESRNRLIDKFAFLTRYAFSCLVDADSTDTADFCKEKELPPPLSMDFSRCLEIIDKELAFLSKKVKSTAQEGGPLQEEGGAAQTELQKARILLQEQAFQRGREEPDGEIYLMGMPTGSGKTLASVRFALEQAIVHKKKRIIYVIPYNSIIDQTAEKLETLFEKDMPILRHQSTFSYEDEENGSEDYREAAKIAVENWNAPFIITTAVQFFESVYSNKRGKLRKLHRMADSILIFDEAHLMPVSYLQPCLQAISYLTKYLNSRAVFLTATMPDYEKLIHEYALRESKVVDLIQDTSLFAVFRKCRYENLGEKSLYELLEQASEYPTALLIVNRKKTARRLFNEAKGRKYHLSTYMTVCDRSRVLHEIKEELEKLEKEYPLLADVPEERRILVVSTSLIEAGVDLDMSVVFRELTGLDSILQAGGRCNREGGRKGAKTFIFQLQENEERRVLSDERKNLTKGLLKEYEDISSPECIKEYYRRLYFMNRNEIDQHTIHRECTDIRSIPFKEYAKSFSLIDQKTVSLVVPQDEKSRELVEKLRYTKGGSARQLENYTCTLYAGELADLCRQHAADDYGTGIYCLTNPDYYDEKTGISFEATDYFI